jgi:hypothetical protein
MTGPAARSVRTVVNHCAGICVQSRYQRKARLRADLTRESRLPIAVPADGPFILMRKFHQWHKVAAEALL